MNHWKIELGPGPAPELMRYRAVIEAQSFDVAVEAARQRMPILRFYAAQGQCMTDEEIADLPASAERFVWPARYKGRDQ